MSADMGAEGVPPEQQGMRRSIRQAVQLHGAWLKQATPAAVVATLVAAACVPVVAPLLGAGSAGAALTGVIGLLGSTGGSYINDFLKDWIERLRGQRRSFTDAELQDELRRELLVRLEAGDARSEALRADAARVLQAVHGVEAALDAAAADVQQALAQAFQDLGQSFEEFGWMLNEAWTTLVAIQREQASQGVIQRHQLELLREQRTKLNLLVRRFGVRPPAAAPAVADSLVAEVPFTDQPCPYKGLEAFQAEDADYFFGRETLVADLAVRVTESNLLAVIGPSGVGKSSVLRAGVVPAVWDGSVSGGTGWTTVVMTPGAEPLEELAIRIALLRGIAPSPVLADLETDPRALDLAVRQALIDEPDDAYLLLVVDQFEEIFTLCHSELRRRQFVNALLGALTPPTGRTVLVLGLRSDFLGHCSEYQALVDALQDRLVVVGMIDEDGIRRTIEGPAEQARLALEPGLVERILRDVIGQPGALPFLSHALLETWQRRRGGLLTLNGYADAGGVGDAIARTAQSVYDAFPPEQQAIARRTFVRLVHLGDGTEDVRRRQSQAELRGAGDDQALVEATLQQLTDRRLLTRSGSFPDAGDSQVELAHETLITAWPKLRAWIEDSRADEILRRRIERDARDWKPRKRDVLYRGRRLAEALAWTGRHPSELSRKGRAFLAAGRRLRLAWRAAIATLVVAALAGVAWLATPQVRQWQWRSQATALGPTVYLAGGVALVGSERRHVAIPSIRMEVHEVTNRQYRLCVRASRCQPPLEPADEAAYTKGDPALPVVYVTAYQASVFCSWLDRRLPSKAEWERAARGLDGRPYPWGTARPSRAHVNAIVPGYSPNGLVPADSSAYREGMSREGVQQLLGNAREWTATQLRYDQNAIRTYELGAWNGRELVRQLAVMGGAWETEADPADIAEVAEPTSFDRDTGFRCVVTAS